MPFTTYTPPTVSMGTPRWTVSSTKMQYRWARYFRPLDFQCNTFVLSDSTVVTDYPIALDNGGTSSTQIPYIWDPAGSPSIGPPEGADFGPLGPPYQPFALVSDVLDLAVAGTPGSKVRQYSYGGVSAEGANAPAGVVTNVGAYIKYLFLGGHGPFHNLSSNLITILTNAHLTNYLS